MSFTWDHLEHLRPKEKDEWKFPLPPTCGECGYNLTGLPQNRCPECGTSFDWREVRQQASETWSLILRLQHANRDAWLGLCLVLGGWVVVGLVRLPFMPPGMHLIDLLAGGAGLVGIVLGCQVFKVRRIPVWARPHFGNREPNQLLGVGALALGLALLIVPWLLP